MTALAFPLTPVMRARLDARADAVAAARVMLRSEAPHKASDIREACHALMTYGSHWDWAEAYHVLRALDAPPAPVADGTQGLIRGALVDVAGLAVIIAVAFAAYHLGDMQ